MANYDELVKQQKNPDFPFVHRIELDEPVIEIRAGEIFDIFNPIFDEFGIYGNGPGWDGLITQALEKVDRELLSCISFDSEGDCCVIGLETQEDAKRLIEVLKGTFRNEENLRKFLKTVDVDLLDS